MRQLKGKVRQGAEKRVFLSEWKECKVALSRLTRLDVRDDLLHGLRMLQGISRASMWSCCWTTVRITSVLTQYYPPRLPWATWRRH